MDISAKSGTLLHTVCVDGSYEDISRALMYSEVHINATNVNGLSPVHLCVFRSDKILKAIKLLSENGADLNAKTYYEGDTVLHLLVRNVSLSKAETAVMELLHMGADPSVTNKFSRSPADEALMRNYRYLADLLSKRIAVEKSVEEQQKYRYEYYGEMLIEAIRKGEGGDIKFLAPKANVNYRNKNGCAPIHYVVSHWPGKKLDVLNQLIVENADVNIADYEGDTALNLLLKQKCLRESGEMYELSELLMKAGANPYLKDVDGMYAVKLATDNDYQDIRDMILALWLKMKAGDTEFDKSELNEDVASEDKKSKGICALS